MLKDTSEVRKGPWVQASEVAQEEVYKGIGFRLRRWTRGRPEAARDQAWEKATDDERDQT